MSNITKIMTFTSTVEQLIRDKAPGFTGRLPGQRELASRFNLSQSLVHIGMTELKKRGVIVVEPYKGASVAAPRNTAGADDASAVLSIAICEDNPQQRSFWLRAVRLFEQTSPEIRIRTRFFSSARPPENAVFGTRNTIMIRPGNCRSIPLPCVPLSELLSREMLTDLQNRLLPGLHNADWSIALPFQLQVMAQIYDIRGTVGTPPDDFTDYLHWLIRNYGPHAIPVQDLNLLRDCCGINRIEMLLPENGNLPPELLLFLKSLETIGREQLMDPACEKNCDQLRFLLERRIRTVEVFSHRWTERGIFQNGNYRFARPRSAAKRRCLPYFLSVAILAGSEDVSEAERRWFEFLAGADFQILQMQQGLGLSPYADLLKNSCGDRLRDVAEWALHTEFEDNQEPLLEMVWNELIRNLREPVILPLLFGQMTAEQAAGVISGKRLLEPDTVRRHIADLLLSQSYFAFFYHRDFLFSAHFNGAIWKNAQYLALS